VLTDLTISIVTALAPRLKRLRRTYDAVQVQGVRRRSSAARLLERPTAFIGVRPGRCP
jgi:hypothetical protein